MTVPNYHIVIPSRFASSRFPGKPLHPLNGKPMILHVIDRARESKASAFVVATDDQRIAELCEKHAVQVEMTDPAHASGTDRIAEVATRLGWSDDTIIVGLQGDEPATPAGLLDGLARNLQAHKNADMATYCTAIESLEEYQNPHRVKVVRNCHGMAMYFSRSTIPFRRDTVSASAFPDAFTHIGLYAYRCHYLKTFSQLPMAVVEQEEQLEQLRVLYNGGKIHVDLIDEVAAGVDHLSDVEAIEKILLTRFESN